MTASPYAPVGWYRLVWPILRHFEPETAHGLALDLLRHGLLPPVCAGTNPPVLAVRALGLDFANPVGLAAGFDKNAVAARQLPRLGFGFAEVGGVTPKPQAGNPRPRLFRLDGDFAAINRMGFNNQGEIAVAARVRAGRRPGFPLGINLASNTDSDNPAEDFVRLVGSFAPIADYLTVDVSCPNTKNGRMFQDPVKLDDLLRRLLEARANYRTPMLVKLAADLTEGEALAIAEVTLRHGLAGLVVANTSAARPDSLTSDKKAERGGLSGRPIFAASTALLAAIRRLGGPGPVLVGVGGVFTGADAYAKIRAGANLIQLYTAMVYRGPGAVGAIKRELAALLARDGFTGVADAVGDGTLS
ncbi:quinone-dependent dihydroorotate dehydrogenase [Zavarzinia compransoris]|uniref:Dihydroorotate dehydrogenase (quinone) n=1 Tax=Zavarzinia compransoris TaxID=1264899 RepID=A0A317E0R2_9PROT|nr:quinone-dependent dihydroorotate dehydrogenase [Zavarzinia compransoris]PWR18953.1 dihydroorotate dehydrogenase (quinone) [Zavarzinia compransoris]TDP48953.1 dihydroorotate oxidase A [Zavarzinia compransoris]